MLTEETLDVAVPPVEIDIKPEPVPDSIVMNLVGHVRVCLDIK